MSKPSPIYRRGWFSRRLIVGCLFGAAAAMVCAPEVEAQAAPDVSAANADSNSIKVPRYFSLKADRVSLFQGPGAEYPTAWVFKRIGLPVEIIEEAEVWRKVRDAGGAEGWVHVSLLSSRRTALVLPWELGKGGQTQAASATLRDDDRESARVIAQVEAGVLASIITCERGWCRVSVGDYRGYIEQSKLWGTYPNEQIKQ